MRDVREWDETDLDKIVQADQKETTTLDYKASAALAFKDKTALKDGKGTLGEKHHQDLIRDVADASPLKYSRTARRAAGADLDGRQKVSFAISRGGTATCDAR